MNRLNLDFSLQTNEERTKFLEKYLSQSQFTLKPLNNEELETCANYVLWGKDPDGKNPVQKKEIQIQTKNRTWNRKEEESLDALLETPTFNESIIVRPSEARPKITREVFSRKEALTKAPPHIKEVFIDLFKEIDKKEKIPLAQSFFKPSQKKNNKNLRNARKNLININILKCATS